MNNLALINRVILHGDWLMERLGEWADPDSLVISEFKDFLLNKQFTAAHTGLGYRTINHWDEEGLFLEKSTSDGWRKFNLIDIVWLQTMRELREFGLGIQEILEIKRSLTLNKKDSYSLLGVYLTAIASGQDVYLVIENGGKSGIGTIYEIQASEITYPTAICQLRVYLNPIFSKLTNRNIAQGKNQIVLPIGDKQLEVLSEIGNPEVNKIQITKKDGQVNKIETHKNHPTPGQAFQLLRKLSSDGKRKQLTVEIQNGKIIGVNEIEKK